MGFTVKKYDKRNFCGIITFWKPDEKYGWMSNYFLRGVWNGKYKAAGISVEHLFQAAKFWYLRSPELFNECLRQKTCDDAKNFARTNKKWWNPEWHTIKYEVMYYLVRDKFLQHKDLRAELTKTKGYYLEENSPVDWDWGTGGDGRGKNRLGRILMMVRDEIC